MAAGYMLVPAPAPGPWGAPRFERLRESALAPARARAPAPAVAPQVVPADPGNPVLCMTAAGPSDCGRAAFGGVGSLGGANPYGGATSASGWLNDGVLLLVPLLRAILNLQDASRACQQRRTTHTISLQPEHTWAVCCDAQTDGRDGGHCACRVEDRDGPEHPGRQCILYQQRVPSWGRLGPLPWSECWQVRFSLRVR